MEYRLRRSDGDYRWVLDRGTPRFSPDGRFAGYVGSCIDMTDFKQNQDRMLASQKLESLGVMAAGVAHDFGNLLGTIIADADLALSDMAPDAPGRESVQEIATVALRASEIVKLLMASAGAKASPDVFGPVDLNSELEQMLRLLKLSISKQAAIRTTFAKDLPRLRGNIPQIHQVIMNLVTNASEALGGRQGAISVATDWVHLPAASIHDNLFGLAEGDCALECIRHGLRDDGRDARRIFDQFFTTKSTGRGLGLAAVHGIVRSHAGGIRVLSAPGQGSTFEVLFPASAAARTLTAGAYRCAT